MTVLEERIVELESRQAFQDDTIQVLNDALVEQQKLIERLQVQIQALAKRQEEVSPFSASQDEAPPPHY